MTEHELKIIDESIKSYERMISHFEKQILILKNKKVEKCCFEKKQLHKLKIKRIT